MAKQVIDFETNLDTGERTSNAAIAPFVDGEAASAAILNRSPENLRVRTETLRTFGEDTLYRLDADKWIITGGDQYGVGDAAPSVTWSSTTGKFTISDNIVVQPILGPHDDMGTAVSPDTRVDSFTVGGYTATFTFTSVWHAYEGGNTSQLIWEEAPTASIPGGNCVALIEGSPTHILRIRVRDDHIATAAQVASAIGAAGLGAGIYLDFTGTGTVPIDVSTIATKTWNVTKVADREMHYITPAVITSFFGGPPGANDLLDGDSLAIWHSYMVDPNAGIHGGRRESTPSTVNIGTGTPPNTVVTAAHLFNTRVHPDRIPLGIPLCRRIGDTLIFVDGTCTNTGTVSFGPSLITTHVHVNPHASVDVFDIALGSSQSVFELLQAFVNDKGSLDEDETLAGDWMLALANTLFFAESGGGASHLLWRSGASRPDDAHISWHTMSKYELANLGVSLYESVYVTIQGAYLEYATTKWVLHTPATGTGNVVVTIETSDGVNGGVGEANIRGTFRIQNATANHQYDVFPDNSPFDYVQSYTSGFGSNFDDWYSWGVNRSGWFWQEVELPVVDTTVDSTTITAYATTQSLSAAMVTEITQNGVLWGMTVEPVLYGLIPANTITIAPGQAAVGGRIVTLHNSHSFAVNTHIAADVLNPVTTTTPTWYGVYLRTDGVFRIAQLPNYQIKNGPAGSDTAMIPAANVETGTIATGPTTTRAIRRSDYVLVDIVWTTQGDDLTSATATRYAGVMHNGGGVCTYHTAQVYNGTTPSGMISHLLPMGVTAPPTAVPEDVDADAGRQEARGMYTQFSGFSATSVHRSPGAPTQVYGAAPPVRVGSVSSTAILSVCFDAECEDEYSMAEVALTNSVGWPLTHVYGSWYASSVHMLTAPTPHAILDAMDDFDVSFVTGGGDVWISNAVYRKKVKAYKHTGTGVVYPQSINDVSTVIMPCIPKGTLAYDFYYWVQTHSTAACESFKFKVRNLGFFWDRQNRGENYGLVLP